MANGEQAYSQHPPRHEWAVAAVGAPGEDIGDSTGVVDVMGALHVSNEDWAGSLLVDATTQPA